jgi:hypothetical protein
LEKLQARAVRKPIPFTRAFLVILKQSEQGFRIGIHGQKIKPPLTGPIGYFKIIDEAEIYAVEMAKTWIDVKSVDDLTP